MKELKGLNLTMRNNMMFIFTTPKAAAGYGERNLLIGYNKKYLLKHIKLADLYIFGSPEEYINGLFLSLNSTLGPRTRNKLRICISNAKTHIESHIENGGKVEIIGKPESNLHPVFENILTNILKP